MSRSIHTTYSKIVKTRKKYSESRSEELKNKLDSLYDDLDKKHTIKKQIRLQRKENSLSDSCLNADDLPIFFNDESSFIHFPISEDDIRNVLNKLPKGILGGLKAIILKFGGWNRDIAYDLEPDPFTGRPGYEVIPGVYLPPILGTYFRNDSRIELYAFIYDVIPDKKIWTLYLKINMLMTLIHEIYHHYDFTSRRSRGRWIMESNKTEVYAENMEYKWLSEILIDYVQSNYSVEAAELSDWLYNNTGIQLTIKDIIEDPRRTSKNGFVKFGSGMGDCIGDLIKEYYLGREKLELRMSFAENLHYADFYDYSLEITESILNADSLNIYRYKALTLKADTLIHLERYFEAQQFANEALAINKEGYEVWNVLCNIYQNQTQWNLLLEAACKAYQFCSDELPKPRLLLTQVRSLIELRRFEEARIILDGIDVSKRKFVERRVNELRVELQDRLTT